MSSVTTHNENTSDQIAIPNGNEEWNDVTDILDSITSTMELGQMVHASDFSLHSAMSALEIGDGVLDAAMKERQLYIEDILNNKELIATLMSVSQNDKILIGVFDELIKLLWSFFNGNSDQFSIYSCLYLYDQIRNHPLNKSNEILYLFIDAIKLCCGYAREIVAISGIAEDDDWAKGKDFKFSDFTNINKITNQLQNKINELKNVVKLSENSSDEKKNTHDMQENENENKTYSKPEYAQAISYRFEFIAGLLNIMKEMYNVTNMLTLDGEQKDDTNVADNETKNQKSSKTSPTQSDKDNAKKTPPQNANNKKKSKTKHQPQQRGKGKKGKGKGKNKGKQQRKGAQNQPQKKGAKPKQSQQNQQNKTKGNQQSKNKNITNGNVTSGDGGECGMLIIDCGLTRDKCNVTKQVLDRHKSMIQSFKQLSSALLRIVNHLIETEMYGLSSDKLLGFDDRMGNNKSVHAPRKQRAPDRLDCFKLFNNWCKCIRFMCNICKLDSFDGFIDYLNAFNDGFGCEMPNVIIRSFLTIIIEQFAKYNTFLWSGKPLIHFIQKSFNNLCEWSRIFGTTNKQYLGDYHTFFSRVETAIRDIVRQKLLHITRQMDWTKRIVKNWQILQTESPEIDRLTQLSYLSGFDDKYHQKINGMDEYKCCQSPYSSWIIDKCCNSMINYIFIHLNKDMELYADYEIEYIYYYLEYLFRAKTQIYQTVSLKRYQKVNLEKLNELINPNYAAMKARKLKKKGKIIKEKKEENKVLPPFEPVDKYFYLMTEAQRCLCLGLFELIQSFYQINKEYNNILLWNGLSDRIDIDEKGNEIENKNDNIPFRLGDESLRFQHRFNIFGHVDQPLPISYRQYRTIMYEYDKKYKSLNAKFKQTEQQFTLSAKNFGLLLNGQKFTNIPSFQEDYITAARRVAIMNKIFTSKLHKIVQQNKNQAVNIKHHFDKHPFYATFEINESKITQQQ